MTTRIASGTHRLCRLVGWLLLAALVGLTAACSKFDSTQNAHNGPQMTAKFFDSKFKDVNDNIIDLSTLRGKTVVVNFWSTWCPPCIEEMPMFNELQNQWKDKNVVFVGIAADQADLLILSVNDYRHLGYRFGTNLVAQVMKKGRLYPNPV